MAINTSKYATKRDQQCTSVNTASKNPSPIPPDCPNSPYRSLATGTIAVARGQKDTSTITMWSNGNLVSRWLAWPAAEWVTLRWNTCTDCRRAPTKRRRRWRTTAASSDGEGCSGVSVAVSDTVPNTSGSAHARLTNKQLTLRTVCTTAATVMPVTIDCWCGLV